QRRGDRLGAVQRRTPAAARAGVDPGGLSSAGERQILVQRPAGDGVGAEGAQHGAWPDHRPRAGPRDRPLPARVATALAQWLDAAYDRGRAVRAPHPRTVPPGRRRHSPPARPPHRRLRFDAGPARRERPRAFDETLDNPATLVTPTVSISSAKNNE